MKTGKFQFILNLISSFPFRHFSAESCWLISYNYLEQWIYLCNIILQFFCKIPLPLHATWLLLPSISLLAYTACHRRVMHLMKSKNFFFAYLYFIKRCEKVEFLLLLREIITSHTGDRKWDCATINYNFLEMCNTQNEMGIIRHIPLQLKLHKAKCSRWSEDEMMRSMEGGKIVAATKWVWRCDAWSLQLKTILNFHFKLTVQLIFSFSHSRFYFHFRC